MPGTAIAAGDVLPMWLEFAFQFFPAFVTDAIEIVHMACEGKTAFSCDVFLPFFNVGIVDFFNFSALEANEMVMVAGGIGHFVAGDVIAEMDFSGKTGFTEELKRPVDCGLTDAGILLGNNLVEFLKRMMPWKIEKCLSNDTSLHCCIHAFALHKGQKIFNSRRFFIGHSVLRTAPLPAGAVKKVTGPHLLSASACMGKQSISHQYRDF